MTYTFKLSRRLAVSRYAAFAAVATLIACDGETTAPETTLDAPTGAAPWIRVVPSTVTIETHQPIRFRGERRTARGEARPTQVWWQASGGTIDEQGNFVAAAPGVYKVIGRGRGRQKPDTSTVVVVPKQPDLTGVSVTPDTVTVAAGATETLSATGILSDGSTAAIGVTWKATGGSIDAGGTYTAGTTAGTYRIIATTTDGNLADTARVTIPEPSAPSAPTLTRVVLKPGSVSLTTGATKQFTAYGWNSAGDSVAVAATFIATGGTISSSGLYTAGASAGTYRVVAAAEGLEDTTAVTLNAPTAGGAGVAFGPFALFSKGDYFQPFTMGVAGTNASGVINLLGNARSNGVKLLLNMTGGSHDLYMSTINGVYQFDMAKWKSYMDKYNTATIRDAVAKAVADGTILGNSVMDEPHVCGNGYDGNTWGPCGTMTKAEVDQMCGYVKAIFPTLPVGVLHRHSVFEPSKNYAVCEFIVDQYVTNAGDVTAFRDAALAFGARSRVSILFGLNILNGGTRDNDGTWDCKDQGGILGKSAPLCAMTASQLRTYAYTLAPAGCGLEMWRWDDAYMARSDNKAAFQDIRDKLSQLSTRGCIRI